MPARFKLDENLPREAEALLRKAGHDVHTVLDEHLGGNPDPRVFDASRAKDRILVTFDLDFSDIRRYPPASHKCLWVLRPQAQSIDNALAMLRGTLALLETEPALGRLWVIEPERDCGRRNWGSFCKPRRAGQSSLSGWLDEALIAVTIAQCNRCTAPNFRWNGRAAGVVPLLSVMLARRSPRR